MEKITGGLSNEVFKYKDLVFKFYSFSLLNLNHDFEELIQKKLFENYKNVPQIYQSICIDNKVIGRVEKYIESSTVTKDHFMSSANVELYAKLLKLIHSLDKKNQKQNDNSPTFFLYLANWSKLSTELYSTGKFNQFENFKLIQENANQYIEGLLSFISQMQFDQCICHNDFQQLNVLVDTNNNYYIIDFEYASLNYIYYDIANFFAECALDNKSLTSNPENYPSTDFRFKFYKEYFKDTEQNASFNDIDYIVSHFCPLVEYVWYIWSLIKYSETENADYIDYGKIREKNFLDKLNKLKNIEL